jgi:hypothetical protein
MDYGDAEAKLKAMLQEAGVDLAAPDPLRTWGTFKQFAAIPVEGVDPDGGDMFLFQWGTSDWYDGKGERFEIDFLRQFSINAPGGEYDHMEQLHCTFFFAPSDELRAFDSGDEWIVGDLDSGFATVEAFPVFGVLQRPPARPAEVRIEQEQV